VHLNSEQAKTLEHYGQSSPFKSIGAETGMRSTVLQNINVAMFVDIVNETYLNMEGFGRSLLKHLKGFRLAVPQPCTVASLQNSVHA
jgi:hypothetical protein